MRSAVCLSPSARRVLACALSFAAAVVLTLSGCASTGKLRPAPALQFAPATPPQKIEDVSGVATRLFREGRLYIGGQPDSLALRTLASRGVVAVMNLRTPSEMDDRKSVPYDEPALARELGLAYVSAPAGGEKYPYTPAVLDSFVALASRTSGPILLHCQSGTRASWVWASYLVRELGWAPQDALDRGRMIGIGPDVLQSLSGKALKVVPR